VKSDYITEIFQNTRRTIDNGYRVLEIAESVLLKRQNPLDIPEINDYLTTNYSGGFCDWIREFFEKTVQHKETPKGDSNG